MVDPHHRRQELLSVCLFDHLSTLGVTTIFIDRGEDIPKSDKIHNLSFWRLVTLGMLLPLQRPPAGWRFPMCLLQREDFVEAGELLRHEDAREAGKLRFFDDPTEVAEPPLKRP